MWRSSASGCPAMTLEHGGFSLFSTGTMHQDYWLITMQGDWQLTTEEGIKSLPQTHITHGYPALGITSLAPSDTCHAPLILVIQCRADGCHADVLSAGQ
jgi:hypothetical protein